jgi:cell division protein ZapA
MSDASSSGTDGSTAVTIYGRTYRLRGGGSDQAHLSELAALVDMKMREIEQATGTADTLKIAILASLNLADDLLRASRGSGASVNLTVDPASDQRLARMVTLLDEVLTE